MNGGGCGCGGSSVLGLSQSGQNGGFLGLFENSSQPPMPVTQQSTQSNQSNQSMLTPQNAPQSRTEIQRVDTSNTMHEKPILNHLNQLKQLLIRYNQF